MIVTKKICKELSDNEIVEKSIANIDYFSCLYNRYEAALLRYVKRMALIDDDQAEDILQEAFIKIWENLHDFNQDMKLSSWIYRIVHNEAISYWRKKKSFGKDRQIMLNDNLPEDIPIDFEIVDGHKKNNLSTHEILELLPLKYKSVLVLKFIERMNYQEISDVLKIPEGTVATRINRAKKKAIEVVSKKHVSF